ncbi:MAG: DUF4446 family protein [Actinomycetota bacterium]|nr:DUF4446 family protein [Actinomycetota bacterium]
MIQENIAIITIVIAALLVIGFALIIYLLLRLRQIQGEYRILSRGLEGKNFVEVVNDNILHVANLSEEVEELSERYAWVLRRMAGALQHVGVVRFNAFRDLGGVMSFSVALLDDRGNGIVISSIYGRTESRTYAKPIVERTSQYELSPEEKEAIRLAMQSKEKGALPIQRVDEELEEKMEKLRLFHEREYQEKTVSRAGAAEPARAPGRPSGRRERPYPRGSAEQSRERASETRNHLSPRRQTGKTRAADEPPGTAGQPRPYDHTEELSSSELAPGFHGEAEQERVARRAPTGRHRATRPGEKGEAAEPDKERTTRRGAGLNTPIERLRRKSPEERGENHNA